MDYDAEIADLDTYDQYTTHGDWYEGDTYGQRADEIYNRQVTIRLED